MLVANVADDLLDDVFEGHETRGAPELVAHDRHVQAARAHVLQDLRGGLVLADEHDGRAQDVGELRRGEPAVAHHDEEVLRVEQADDVVDVLAVDGVARVLLGRDQRDHLGQRSRELDAENVTPRDHDLARGRDP